MAFNGLSQLMQVGALNFLLGLQVDHELIPAFDFRRLGIDGVIDPGQKQANDGGNNQLLVSVEIAFDPALALWTLRRLCGRRFCCTGQWLPPG